jgi:hypothetical protein
MNGVHSSKDKGMKRSGMAIWLNFAGLLLTALILSGFLTGCATVTTASNDLKAVLVKPAPDAGFIKEPGRQTRRPDLPFQKAWLKPGLDLNKYREVYVAPVNTEHMLQMDWLHAISTANLLGNFKQDVNELAVYFRDKVKKEFRKNPDNRFLLIDYPGVGARPLLSLELALIEVEPSEPILHAVGWVVIGGTVAAGVINPRRASFEGRLRDLQSGEVVATFADRNTQDIGPIDLTRYTWYGPAKTIMDKWAKLLVQVANRKQGEIVNEPIAFTLRPF